MYDSRGNASVASADRAKVAQIEINAAKKRKARIAKEKAAAKKKTNKKK